MMLGRPAMIILLVHFMRESTPTVSVSGPLVDLRPAVQQYRRDSVENGHCWPCSSGEWQVVKTPDGGTWSLPESSHCQHLALTGMAQPRLEVSHDGIDPGGVEVHPSHTELARPGLVARCSWVRDEEMKAKVHCFHHPRRCFQGGMEKYQWEASRLAEYPQMCDGGLDSGLREE